MTRAFRTAFVAALSSLSLSFAAFAGDELWTQDYKAALEKAKAENHDVLVDFTGSDWCIWCQRLDQEVFATDTFKTEAPKHFVLLKLDFPNDPSLVTDVVREQNTKLMAEFGVQGFPTIYLLDASGRPYAKTGYEPGGPETYLENLAELRSSKTKRDEALTAAGALTGVDKAKALDKALGMLDEETVLPFYRAEVDEIVTLDARDEAGLKSKYEARLADFAEAAEGRKLESIAQEFGTKGDFAGMRTAIEAFIAEHQGKSGLLQKAEMIRALTFAQEKNFDEAIRLLDEAVKLKPESELVAQIEAIKKQLEMAKMMGGAPDEEDDSEETEEPEAPAPASGGGR